MRIGQSLDQLITDWGLPTREGTIAGRHLIYWEETELSYELSSKVSIDVPIGSNGSVSATVPLNKPQEQICARVVQIDAQELVVAASLKGSNCPYYAPNNW